MPQMKKVKTAIIGCGTICNRIYAPNLMEKFHIIDLVACADRIPERAQALADKYSLKVMTNEEIYQDPEIEIVVNLTCPESHYEVSKAAILAGKNVYCEKMMAVTLEAVSYTHLDVYKRQARRSGTPRWSFRFSF